MLDFILNQSNIGIYNKCEIIEVFGIRKNDKTPFNIFTLVVFENTKQEKTKEFSFDKLQKFKGIKDIKWGIQRRIVNIDIVKKLYDDLLNNEIFQIDDILEVGSLKLLPEQYVQSEDWFNNPQLNHILKNNFKYGSYILEFFDEDKGNCQFLLDAPELLNSFSENLTEKLPIKIGNLSDRLGNIILQFPINSFTMTWTTIKNKELRRYEGIKVEIEPKNSNFNLDNLLIRIYEENDNVITRQRLIEVKDNIVEILLDDCFGTTIEIFDKKSSFILYKNKFTIMKEMNSIIAIQEPQKRVFNVNGKTEEIVVSHNQSNTYGKANKDNKEFNLWISDRKYEDELKELEEKKSFIQYYGKQESKALLDVRELIKKYGENGVYLWDPYLSADDIKKTLYFSANAHVPLKAIRGFKKNDNQEHKKQIKENMKNIFNSDEQQFLFLNLEVRGKIDNNGYDFHDRFLIFPLEKPKVWSLGTSVNSLGKSHHIMQEVKHAQHILNTFNDLWKKLDKEECLIWKSR
ncbi:VPA1262 family N-terminal domain-containing protein [Candidatus Marinarcus aquaticus]|uniref:Phospholipase D-like domain-containing protein n=1 Tax=Candidatus Marinarcus aquaticus TaxID=2044504 RepID=A0A4Q0XNM3_9BACT|nr:VPA1262 family N-terminal domain-containing protein [Candidatus Marinarcus aquaticus]RXJ54136.1 hypothetical protein CRV04_12200 [Candidatus Marinarcus aquaticus]